MDIFFGNQKQEICLLEGRTDGLILWGSCDLKPSFWLTIWSLYRWALPWEKSTIFSSSKLSTLGSSGPSFPDSDSGFWSSSTSLDLIILIKLGALTVFALMAGKLRGKCGESAGSQQIFKPRPMTDWPLFLQWESFLHVGLKVKLILFGQVAIVFRWINVLQEVYCQLAYQTKIPCGGIVKDGSSLDHTHSLWLTPTSNYRATLMLHMLMRTSIIASCRKAVFESLERHLRRPGTVWSDLIITPYVVSCHIKRTDRKSGLKMAWHPASDNSARVPKRIRPSSGLTWKMDFYCTNQVSCRSWLESLL